jgi:endoglucanase
MFNDISAADLVRSIKVGWNLGDTLDAFEVSWFGKNVSVARLEKEWNNPVTTKANIDAVRNAGFNAVRIPVSWAKCVDSSYRIRADWMTRVTEVVNYVLDNDMYAILNTHHDEILFKLLDKDMDSSQKAFKKIWEQIAAHFRNEGERLIFESLNEPRTIGSASEWDGGTAEERNNLNILNQLFVDTVRADGGNNSLRILMIPDYAAAVDTVALDALVIPNDPAKNKIVVSIHAYFPYDFVLNVKSPVDAWERTSVSDTSPITDPIDYVHKLFVSRGIPVIIGEFGAINKNNIAARVAWTAYYVKYARDKGIPCFWWDNGTANTGDPDAEWFGLLNRKTNTFMFPEIIDALMQSAKFH